MGASRHRGADREADKLLATTTIVRITGGVIVGFAAGAFIGYVAGFLSESFLRDDDLFGLALSFRGIEEITFGGIGSSLSIVAANRSVMNKWLAALLNFVPGFGLGYFSLGWRRAFRLCSLSWLAALSVVGGILLVAQLTCPTSECGLGALPAYYASAIIVVLAFIALNIGTAIHLLITAPADRDEGG